MIASLSFFILILVSAELFIVGSIAGFLQKKHSAKVIARILLTAVSIFGTIIFGKQLGLWGAKTFPNYAIWYGTSILFILSLKYMYDGIRLKKIKTSINPLDNQGLFILLFTLGINGLFLGITFGLFKLNTFFNFYILIACVGFAFIGLFVGPYLKKLIGFKYEVLISVLLLVSTIIIISNS